MNRTLLLGILIFLVVVGISLVGEQPQAQAGCWGGWGGWGYHSYWSPVAYHRPLRWHHHRYASPYWGGYGCGCYGYSAWAGCGCYGYTGCGCYGYVGCGCYGYPAYSGGMIMETPQVVPQVAPQPAAPQQAPTPPPPQPTATDAAQLNLNVPDDAKVVINDHVTKSTGEVRRYVSRGLTPDMNYEFEIRAEVVRNGQVQSRTKIVRLKANQSADLDFDFDSPQVASR